MVADLALSLVKLATAGWLGCLAWRSGARIATRRPRSVFFPIVVLFLFFGLPLVFDVAIGQPRYELFPPIFVATRDAATSVMYCVAVASAGALLWLGRGKGEPKWFGVVGKARISIPPTLKLVAVGCLILPAIAVWWTPHPELYLSYGAVLTNALEMTNESGHDIVALATVLSIVGVCAIALSSKSVLRALIVLLPFIVLAAWLNGKRHYIAFVLAILMYVVWRRGLASGRKLFVVGMICASGLAVFSYMYQSEMRGVAFAAGDREEGYENLRVDFGRDHVVQLALYPELGSGRARVLEYRGQSLLFTALFFVPRSLWPGKPLPYAQYATSAAFGTPPRLWGWGLTTSILDELVANTGFVGLLLAPLLLVVICRCGDRTRSEFVGCLSPIIACLLLVVQVSAFTVIACAWLVAGLWERRPRREQLRFKGHYQDARGGGAVGGSSW